VKGHSNSKGNQLADAAASRAVEDQAADLDMDPRNENSARHLARADVPAMWKELGPDRADEWLLRANEHIINRRYAYRYEEFDVQEEQFDVREEITQLATTQPGDYNAIPVSNPIELTDASGLQRAFIFPALTDTGMYPPRLLLRNCRNVSSALIYTSRTWSASLRSPRQRQS
jgi:hypothetical protein